jgi:hypothetical protein
MIIGKAIYATLAGNSPVSSAAVGGIVPERSSEIGKLYPQIVYAGDDEEDDECFDGPSGLVTQKVRITTLTAGDATQYGNCANLAALVKSAMVAMPGTVAGIRVQGVFFESEDENNEANEDAGETSVVYLIEQAYTIVYNS